MTFTSQNGTDTPASRSLAKATDMHCCTVLPSARMPCSRGPPLAANVHAGALSATLSASTLIMAFTPCSPSHSKISSVTSSMSLSRSVFGHRP